MGEHGGCQDLIRQEPGFRAGVYIYKGTLVSEVLGKVFELKYKDIEFLMLGKL
jgi:alanine dehydrogenase